MLRRSVSKRWKEMLCLLALVAARHCRAERNAVQNAGGAVRTDLASVAFVQVQALHLQRGGACVMDPRVLRCPVGAPLRHPIKWEPAANPTACRMLPDGYPSGLDDAPNDDASAFLIDSNDDGPGFLVDPNDDGSAFLVDPLAAGEPSGKWIEPADDKPGTALTPAELDHIPTIDGRDVDPLRKRSRKKLLRRPPSSPSGWSLAREKRKRQSDSRQLQVKIDSHPFHVAHWRGSHSLTWFGGQPGRAG